MAKAAMLKPNATKAPAIALFISESVLSSAYSSVARKFFGKKFDINMLCAPKRIFIICSAFPERGCEPNESEPHLTTLILNKCTPENVTLLTFVRFLIDLYSTNGPYLTELSVNPPYSLPPGLNASSELNCYKSFALPSSENLRLIVIRIYNGISFLTTTQVGLNVRMYLQRSN